LWCWIEVSHRSKSEEIKENKLRKFPLNSTQLFNSISSPPSAFSHSWRNKSRAESVPHVNSIDKLIVICAINFRTAR
jgi:hypothetical protein